MGALITFANLLREHRRDSEFALWLAGRALCRLDDISSAAASSSSAAAASSGSCGGASDSRQVMWAVASVFYAKTLLFDFRQPLRALPVFEMVLDADAGNLDAIFHLCLLHLDLADAATAGLDSMRGREGAVEREGEGGRERERALEAGRSLDCVASLVAHGLAKEPLDARLLSVSGQLILSAHALHALVPEVGGMGGVGVVGGGRRGGGMECGGVIGGFIGGGREAGVKFLEFAFNFGYGDRGLKDKIKSLVRALSAHTMLQVMCCECVANVFLMCC